MPCHHEYELQVEIKEHSDQLFSCGGRPYYLSVTYHRSKARVKDKSTWAISRDDEAKRFFCAFDHDRKSEEYPGLWHIETGGDFIGTAKELIAFFPEPINVDDAWHGYPYTFRRSAKNGNDNPGKALKEVAQRMLEGNEITVARAIKIRRGAL